jgi:hypothetical protein
MHDHYRPKPINHWTWYFRTLLYLYYYDIVHSCCKLCCIPRIVKYCSMPGPVHTFPLSTMPMLLNHWARYFRTLLDVRCHPAALCPLALLHTTYHENNFVRSIYFQYWPIESWYFRTLLDYYVHSCCKLCYIPRIVKYYSMPGLVRTFPLSTMPMLLNHWARYFMTLLEIQCHPAALCPLALLHTTYNMSGPCISNIDQS